MVNPTNSSFIPKRGPVQAKRGKQTRKVFLFTIISYVLVFSSLLASAAVFLYGNYIENQREMEIAKLNTELQSFSEAEMQRVLDFDTRLEQARARVANSVSVVSIFEAIEAATIDTVQFDSLAMERVGDNQYELSGSVITDTFDSAIFQRGVYTRNPIIESVNFESLQTTSLTDEDGAGRVVSGRPVLTFKAQLQVPVSSVPFQAEPLPVQFETSTEVIEPDDDSAVIQTD